MPGLKVFVSMVIVIAVYFQNSIAVTNESFHLYTPAGDRVIKKWESHIAKVEKAGNQKNVLKKTRNPYHYAVFNGPVPTPEYLRQNVVLVLTV